MGRSAEARAPGLLRSDLPKHSKANKGAICPETDSSSPSSHQTRSPALSLSSQTNPLCPSNPLPPPTPTPGPGSLLARPPPQPAPIPLVSPRPGAVLTGMCAMIPQHPKPLRDPLLLKATLSPASNKAQRVAKETVFGEIVIQVFKSRLLIWSLMCVLANALKQQDSTARSRAGDASVTVVTGVTVSPVACGSHREMPLCEQTPGTRHTPGTRCPRV